MVLSSNLVLIGAGGFADEVAAMIDEVGGCHVLGNVVDDEYYQPELLGTIDWLKEKDVSVLCCIADTRARERITRKVESWDLEFYKVIHPSAGRIKAGHGSVVAYNCTISPSVKIGKHVHLNPACIIGHDVIIEDCVTVCPGAIISGNVLLKRGCFVGTGAIVLPGLEVGEYATVGAGAVCLHSVSENETVVGVPAKALES